MVQHRSGKNQFPQTPHGLVLTLAPLLLVLGFLVWPTDKRAFAQVAQRNDDVQADQPKPPLFVQPPPLFVQPPQPPPPPSMPSPVFPRFQFTITENTSLKDLLPTPPSIRKAPVPALPKSLADVQELDFQAPLARNLSSHESMKRTAHLIAKVNHLNAKKPDGFLEALLGERPDLAGLPMAMGDACRIKGERSRQLTRAVTTVRIAMRQHAFVTAPSFPVPPPLPGVPQASTPPLATVPTPVEPNPGGSGTVMITSFGPGVGSSERVTPQVFWDQYSAACAQEDKQVPTFDRTHQENVTLARIAALTQILAPESPTMRLGLVKHLATISHVEATRALARLALFSEEAEVREAALAVLKVRRDRDYTDILLSGLSYPWPPVAQRGAEAMVKLERTDLVPHLVKVLDQPDPRAPVATADKDVTTHQVRELVRINHHRNCLLCHAPGNTGGVSGDTLTAAVPVPSDPLPSPSEGYQNSSPDVLVRIDVTYLRPDFSVFQAVADAHPWPEMQRFDFLVRKRELTDKEVVAFQEQLATNDPGRPSPYHRAALGALRELTGRDAAPTAEAWRRLLNLSNETRQTAQ